MIAIKQYPLCLAWALTIHKIQGATLAMAEVDIGESIFEYGQTYVAISRVQSLEGLYLSAFRPERIQANPKVTAFYEVIKPITTLQIESLRPIPISTLEETANPDVKIIRL
jgi:ATP-dependent DNA helicase PIF1